MSPSNSVVGLALARLINRGFCAFERSVLSALGGLRGALISDHLLLQGREHVLDAHGRAVPGSQVPVLGEVNITAATYRRKVHLRVEFDSRGLRRVVLSADDREEEDAAVEGGAGGSDDGAVPVGEGLVVGVVQTVGGHGITRAVLTILQLFQKFERSRCYTKFAKDILVKPMSELSHRPASQAHMRLIQMFGRTSSPPNPSQVLPCWAPSSEGGSKVPLSKKGEQI